MSGVEGDSLLRFAIGLLAGLGLAAGLWTLIAARQAGRARAESADSPGPPQGVSAAAGPEPGTRGTLQAVQAEIAKLQAEAEALKAQPPSTTATKKRSFADLATKLVPAFVENRWIWETDDERAQALIGPFLEELREQAFERGISIYEAAQGPDGLAALAMAMMAVMDPPLDADTMKKLEEARAALGQEFDAYLAKRGSLSRLEQFRELNGVGLALARTVDENLSEEASTMWWNASSLFDQANPTSFVSMYSGTPHPMPPLEDICRSWAESWSSTLGLDAAQKLALKPIVDEYARAIADLNRAAESRRTGNHTPVPNRDDLLTLMIRAQARIAAEASLTEQQRKALRDWSSVPFHPVGGER